MIGEFNSDRQEVWYLETSTLTVAALFSLLTNLTLFSRLMVLILPRLRSIFPARSRGVFYLCSIDSQALVKAEVRY